MAGVARASRVYSRTDWKEDKRCFAIFWPSCFHFRHNLPRQAGGGVPVRALLVTVSRVELGGRKGVLARRCGECAEKLLAWGNSPASAGMSEASCQSAECVRRIWQIAERAQREKPRRRRRRRKRTRSQCDRQTDSCPIPTRTRKVFSNRLKQTTGKAVECARSK